MGRSRRSPHTKPTPTKPTYILTGATSGIGRATATALAGSQARLVLVCRDLTRGEQVRSELRGLGGDIEVELAQADLSSQASIRTLAAELLDRCPRIDVLVNNAGVVNVSREVTEDGFEQTFAVNHLAYFLLTNLLLDRLRTSAPARIVNVASEAHKFGALDFDDLGSEQGYSTMRVYGKSKRANILFTYALARRLEGSGVTVNCLHPGAVATGLAQNNGWWAVALTKLLSPFFRGPAKGAATSVYLATSPNVEGVSGRYFYNCKELRSDDRTYDEGLQDRLWSVSEEMTGLRA